MIGVLGAGAFGTALAVVHGLYDRPAMLWGRNAKAIGQMTRTRTSGHLSGVVIPDLVSVTPDMNQLDGCSVLILAMPMQALRGFVAENATFLNGRLLVACCKGIDLVTLTGATQILHSACPKAVPMILTGPSFAADIANKRSTALTLACVDESAAAIAQTAISVPSLRLYRNTDVIGAELGGALKNVIAIACGACIGEGMGESARAALMTRGFAEMQRLAIALGARPETLMGLSGFGDLVLTCTSEQSRNYRYGLALGHGDDFDKTITVEGIATAQAAVQLAKRMGVDMPITSVLVDLFDGTSSVAEAIQYLLSRPLKQE